MKGILRAEPQQQQSPASDVGGADKKKKRRSNRRPKQSDYAVSAASSSANEIRLEAPESVGDGCTSNYTAVNEQLGQKASSVSFISLPTMHINDQALILEDRIQYQEMLQYDFRERMFPQSCPDSLDFEVSTSSPLEKDIPLLRQSERQGQGKFYTSHWSTEAVNMAIEKGDVFKALFRVNAHNQLEAYCKIDGVPVDVLVTGINFQNRAVDGDIVAVKVDPVAHWTKMKGSVGASNSSNATEECNLLSELSISTQDFSKGKNKVEADGEFFNCRNQLNFSRNSSHELNVSLQGGNVCPQLISSCVNGNHHFASNHSLASSFSEKKEVVTSLEKLCSMVKSSPSKRPTGRVVAIIDTCTRRKAIVGFLNVKQWLLYRQGCRKDNRKNNLVVLFPRRDYILLTPTDPKFPKMMVPWQSLPDCIKKRLEAGDTTLEMELVAAQIVDWSEECDVPCAHIVHVFGRGSEVEPHIAAILFENAIRSTEFSAQTLACLPSVPWKVPREELHCRRDIRNLCTFTIDPSTATDLDDALSVERLSDSTYRVGVHIADVSYFVLPQSTLDIEAQIRSTSVYLLQRKIPMLPPLLSDDLVSLNPGVDRLAFSIFWDIDRSGKVLDRWIGRTVVQSCCKLSYENAQDIIEGTFSVDNVGNDYPHLYGHFQWSDVISSVQRLYEISKILKANRFNDGALSLENPKVVFLFDEDGVPYDSMLSGRKSSNFLVEEFMLLANRTAAEVISKAYPSSALLRRHPEPNLRKLKEFEAFCSKHGLVLDTSTSGKFHNSLECIRQELKNDSLLFDVLMSYATKPMQLATYFCSGNLNDAESDWGHYALAVPLYTHFTSPLRRYPDIIVHRTLAAALEAEMMYLQQKRKLQYGGYETSEKCFTGLHFDEDAVKSVVGQKALSEAALKYSVPCTKELISVAAHCNDRKLASRHVKDAIDRLYMWVLLRKKEILLSEARVMGLGPRFMSIYVGKLAVEKRIYYDEVEGLTVEWLEATSTLILSLSPAKRLQRRGNPGKYKTLEDVAVVVSACNVMQDQAFPGDEESMFFTESGNSNVHPAVFPLTVRLLSTIPVALHAIGGNDGPLDIGARLYTSSYLV